MDQCAIRHVYFVFQWRILYCIYISPWSNVHPGSIENGQYDYAKGKMHFSYKSHIFNYCIYVYDVIRNDSKLNALVPVQHRRTQFKLNQPKGIL